MGIINKDSTISFNDSALIILSDIVENTAKSLYTTLQYLYVIADEDFYNVNSKDIYKVALSDITNPDALSYMGIRLDKEKLGEMHSVEFERVEHMVYYSLIIRLPFLKTVMEDCPLKETQMRELYSMAVKRGAENFGEIIEYDLSKMLKIVKNKEQEPPFDGSWFRRWVYTCGKDLAAINNKNMFMFGCVEALFPLFYSALTERLGATLTKWKKTNE